MSRRGACPSCVDVGWPTGDETLFECPSSGEFVRREHIEIYRIAAEVIAEARDDEGETIQ